MGFYRPPLPSDAAASIGIGIPVTGGPTANGILSVRAGLLASGPATTDGSGNTKTATLAIGGATIGSDALGISGSMTISGAVNLGSKFQWPASFVGMVPNASGIIEINNTSAGTFRDLILRTLNVGATDTPSIVPRRPIYFLVALPSTPLPSLKPSLSRTRLPEAPPTSRARTSPLRARRAWAPGRAFRSFYRRLQRVAVARRSMHWRRR